MILLLLACATLSSDATSDVEPQASQQDASATDVARTPEPVLRDELLPPHFSADAIRMAMPVGTTLVFRTATTATLGDGLAVMGMERQDVQWEVLAADPEQTTIRYGPASAAGESTERTHSWAELATHSQFPAQMTTRQEGVAVTVPVGTFDCTRYTVREPGDTVSVYEFAQGIAGPPVHMVQTVSGQERMRMSLVRRAIP